MNEADKELFLKALRNPVLKKDWAQRSQCQTVSKASILFICTAAIVIGAAIGLYVNGSVQ